MIYIIIRIYIYILCNIIITKNLGNKIRGLHNRPDLFGLYRCFSRHFHLCCL